MRHLERLRTVVLVITIVACALIAVMALLDWSGRHADQLARAAAENNTTNYRQLFALGEPQQSIEEALALEHLNTLQRGSEVLILAREGRRVWYCNHNYFGTALKFTNGKLDAIKSDEWLDTCL